MSLFTASVPPLLDLCVLKYGKNAAFHRFKVFPSRRISGIGQVGNDSRIPSAN
jgi:hypothetical protein